ncbi:MAG: hypothetical protein HZA93_18155 [Verrucomicrobia bacterium]|nr:hypothetical protein [Verrucomicrobiota bacterium]
MKTPLLVLLLLAPLSPVALGGDKSACPAAASLTAKATEPRLAAKPADKPAPHAPAIAAPAEKPRRTPASRPPAHLFM